MGKIDLARAKIDLARAKIDLARSCDIRVANVTISNDYSAALPAGPSCDATEA